MRSARAIFCLFFFAFFFLLFGKHEAFAQQPASYSATPISNSYTAPHMDSDVPRNQHTYAQAVTIEVLAAVMCQLTGIDPIDPGTRCLGINPQTRRLGYAPSTPGEELQIGGLVGLTTDLIASTYQPSATMGVYTDYLSDNFGIVKKTYAQERSYGFTALQPIFQLWKAVRNIAYMLLTLAFIAIGIGVMLRVKIDPRTVMTIQNQIPKVIISIILITLSYAISAFLVDLMWVSTYAGVNMITTSSFEVEHIDAGGEPEGGNFQAKATRQLLEIPLVYTNNIFHKKDTGGITDSGIVHITTSVSENFWKITERPYKEYFGC